MSISSSANSARLHFTATSGQTAFSVSFEFFDNADLDVYVNGTQKTITTHYTVSGGDGSTGTVTFNSGLTLNDAVTITRRINIERVTDFSAGQAINRAALNTQLDTLTAISSDNKDRAERSLRAPDDENTPNMILPSAANRANQVLIFESTGAVNTTNISGLPELNVDKLNVDNVTIDGSEISTTNTNGNLTLNPNGTGDVVISGDLVVNGSTTTVTSTEVNIADKNITVAHGSSDSSAANGAGLTVDGADATFNYTHSLLGWQLNKPLTIGNTTADQGSSLNIYGNPVSGQMQTASISLKSNGTSIDPFVQFAYQSSDVFTVGLDVSDSKKFKIANSSSIGSSPLLTITDAGEVSLGTNTPQSGYRFTISGESGASANIAFKDSGTDNAIVNSFADQMRFVGDLNGESSNAFEFQWLDGSTEEMRLEGGTLKVDSLLNLTGTVGITIGCNLTFDDGENLQLGTGKDLKLYHVSSNSYIDAGSTGNLYISSFNDVHTQVRNSANSAFVDSIVSAEGGATTLFHNGSAKIATTSTGVDITGGITTNAYSYLNGLRISGADTGNTVYQQSGDLSISSASGAISLKPSGTNILHATNTGVGIGCVPNSIQSGFDTLQIGGNLTLNVDSTGVGAGVYMGNNVYRDSVNSRWEYINTDEATQYLQANGEHIWRYAASGTADTAISWSEAMRITSAGNVGIGTSSIDVSTQAGGSGYRVLQIESADGGQLNFDHNDAGTGSTLGQINFQRAGEVVAEIEGVTSGATDSGHIGFRTQATGGALTERMRITSAGNVGIGTSSPTFTSAYGGLHVHSTYPEIHLTGTDSGSGASDGFKIQKNSANHVYLWNYENAFMAFGTNNTERMRIDSSGNVGIGVAPTDPSGFGRIFQLHGASSSIMRFTGSTYGVGANDGPFIGMSYGGLEISNPRSTGYIHLSTAGVVAAKIDSSGRVLMGTATDSNAHANADDLIIGNVPASGEKRGITIVTGNDTSGAIHFSDGTSSGNAHIQGQLVYEHSDNSFRFYTAAAQRVRIDADGLKFGTDTAAANALDDYEEGSYTPTVSGATTAGSTTLDSSFNKLHYTKIGRQVTIGGEIRISGSASGSGLLKISTPFTNINESGSEFCGAIGVWGVNHADGASLTTSIAKAADYLRIIESFDNQSSETAVEITDLAANAELTISITFLTS